MLVLLCAAMATHGWAQSKPNQIPGIGSAFDNSTLNGSSPWTPSVDQWNIFSAYKQDAGGPIITPGIASSSAPSGSSSSFVYLNHMVANPDTMAVTYPNFLQVLGVEDFFGGSTVTGGRSAIFGAMHQFAATSPSNQNRNYNGGLFGVNTASGDGGTNLTTGALGAYFGLNPTASATAGATNLLELTGGEVNTDVETGASAKYKFGWSIAGVPTDAVQGSAGDAAFEIGEQAGAVGWRDGILISNAQGEFPLASNASVLSSDTAGTITNGIDLSNLTFTGNAYKGSDLLLSPSTIAGLPSCASGQKGDIRYVSDTLGLSAPTWHGTVAAGGSTTVNSLVSCNGSNWQYE